MILISSYSEIIKRVGIFECAGMSAENTIGAWRFMTNLKLRSDGRVCGDLPGEYKQAEHLMECGVCVISSAGQLEKPSAPRMCEIPACVKKSFKCVSVIRFLFITFWPYMRNQ